MSESLDRDDLDAVVAFEVGGETDAGFALGGNDSWRCAASISSPRRATLVPPQPSSSVATIQE